uniref:Uncharacterized protein n=1 Tax=Pararge aegeria TaxID=116150 RepID=S4P0U0_9NEOP
MQTESQLQINSHSGIQCANSGSDQPQLRILIIMYLKLQRIVETLLKLQKSKSSKLSIACQVYYVIRIQTQNTNKHVISQTY